MSYEYKKLSLTDNNVVSEIVSLLNVAFDNFNLSEKQFRWKHLECPCGVSYVWGAFHNGRIVGVRLYSKWHSFGGNLEFVQAVDTATHPEHQRKGIFKELILRSTKYLDDKGVIIFNFPNEQSAPQYLKYGWKNNGTLKWNITVLPSIIFSSKHRIKYTKTDSIIERSEFEVWRFDSKPQSDYIKFEDERGRYIVLKQDFRVGFLAKLVYLSSSKIDKRKLYSFLKSKGIFAIAHTGSEKKCIEFMSNIKIKINIPTKKEINFFVKNDKKSMLKKSYISLSDMDFI